MREPAVPYAAAKPIPPGELPDALAPHAGELARLVSFIDLARGFALAFAECNLAPLRASLIDAVRRRCEPALARIVTLDLREAPELASPLDEIANRLPDADAEEDAAVVQRLRRELGEKEG